MVQFSKATGLTDPDAFLLAAFAGVVIAFMEKHPGIGGGSRQNRIFEGGTRRQGPAKAIFERESSGGAALAGLAHGTCQGGAIERIVVSGLQNDTYFAKISVRIGDRVVEIDSRPSDALALAVRAKVPIFVDDEVMQKAGVLLDKETGNAIVGGEDPASAGGKTDPEHRAPVGKEELKKLSAFQDFIESLDLGGLGEEGRGKTGRDDD